MRRSIVAGLCTFLLFTGLSAAEVRLPALLSDHMVVQAGRAIHIWGWADPGERVRVVFNNNAREDTADGASRWSIYLPPQDAGGPYEMTIEGTNRLTVSDILVGEVWVGSGQSNMEWPVERSNDAEKEIVAVNYPKIRLFKVERDSSHAPLLDVKGSWKVCSPESVKDFSAVAYFFARDLHQKTASRLGRFNRLGAGHRRSRG